MAIVMAIKNSRQYAVSSRMVSTSLESPVSSLDLSNLKSSIFNFQSSMPFYIESLVFKDPESGS